MEKDINLYSDLNDYVSGISKKTAAKIMNAWYDSGKKPHKITPDIPEKDIKQLVKQIDSCIKGESGDISKQAGVIHLATIYIQATETGKQNFLKTLASEFDIDLKFVTKKIRELNQIKNGEENVVDAEIQLVKYLTPPRVIFLKQLLDLPNGFIFLKDMREDILRFKKNNPRLKKLDLDIKTILKSYFDINLLELNEISWNSPASVLERLIQYEAVHEIKSWKHLKHRLLASHRMFGFFHPIMPNDPIIFVEVAFVKGLANNIQKLIELEYDPEDAEQADTAIFYSISSTQKGLRGINFGNFLIKQVVKEVGSVLPNIKNFATLSPIPMFRFWLMKYLSEGGDCFCIEEEIVKIINLSNKTDINDALIELVTENDWFTDDNTTEILKKPLLRLCLYYLTKVKRNDKIKAYDPVANFHLSNGAKIDQLNWLGDISEKGFDQSFGIMVNYKYKLTKITVNHEKYMTEGKIYVSKIVMDEI